MSDDRPMDEVMRAIYRGQRISDSERQRLRRLANTGHIAACEALARNAANEAARL